MIECFKYTEDAMVPTKSFSTDGGFDLYSNEDTFIHPNDTQKIKTGIALHIPEGYVGLVMGRSGLASNGLDVLGGVVDATYSGEIRVILSNTSSEKFTVKKHQRIAQIVIVPLLNTAICEVKTLWNSPRGSNGFASTGE